MLHETSKNHIRNSTLYISLHRLSTIRHAVVLSTHHSQWIIQGGEFPDVRYEGIVCVSATGQRWRQRYRFDEVRDMTDRLLLPCLLFKVNVKVALTRQHSHTEGSRCTVQLYTCWNSTIDWVVFNTAPVTELPRKNRGTHWITDWLGPQASPDVSEKRLFFPAGVQTPNRPAHTDHVIPAVLTRIWEPQTFLADQLSWRKRSHCLPIRSTVPPLYKDRFFPRAIEINFTSLGHKALFEVTCK